MRNRNAHTMVSPLFFIFSPFWRGVASHCRQGIAGALQGMALVGACLYICVYGSTDG